MSQSDASPPPDTGDQNMRFELEPYNRNVPDGELLDDLRKVANDIGKNRLTFRDYRRHGRFGTETITRRFGSWNNGLELAGIPTTQKHGIDDDALFANLEAIWRHLGRQPRYRDLDHVTTIADKSTYHRRFGSWPKALEAFVAWVSADEEPVAGAVSVLPLGRKTPRQPNLRRRFRVMSRDKFRCCHCGRSPATTLGCELHVDHVLPWSEGGETAFENLQTLCSNCNLGKSNCSESSPT